MDNRMHKIILALGSNHEAKVNIELALNLLSKSIKIIQSTPSYDNESTEFPISIFTNKILVCETELSYEKLNKELKHIETVCGRNIYAKTTGIIPLDIDILLYDNDRYHINDWDKPYIKYLLTFISLNQ